MGEHDWTMFEGVKRSLKEEVNGLKIKLLPGQAKNAGEKRSCLDETRKCGMDQEISCLFHCSLRNVIYVSSVSF